MSEWIVSNILDECRRGRLAGSSSSDAAYPTCTPGTAAFQQLRLGQRAVRGAGLPEDHPQVSPVQMSHPSVPQRFGGLVHSFARIFFEYHSFTTEFRG
ncbi:uncharacterized protein N7446_012585 [Penicillium canescens]|uniref:uncharacterized protein n=1 Tax=Penicillium canescens TaxID=5083 RepID=UPI0026E0C311|nr:uncharacterized protein N7446_012228 [Penicillium canescens]XP_058366693.1 uncharacterized protein N7446_012585 [Penicillium canescens]KAJ6045364.1 hypothetical protein N7446_012228 [Penicillium canescens]KAJ6045721.1 hypothetical protein N7446_012585 [Penicillium canescens]